MPYRIVDSVPRGDGFAESTITDDVSYKKSFVYRVSGDGGLAELRSLLRADLATRDGQGKVVLLAPNTVVDPAPDAAVVKTPTQAELDRAQFENDAHLLASLQRGVDSGVIDAASKSYTDLRDSVKARYLAHPEYAGLL